MLNVFSHIRLTMCFYQAFHHSTLALEGADGQQRAEASLILAGVLKDLGQFDKAEEVTYYIHKSFSCSNNSYVHIHAFYVLFYLYVYVIYRCVCMNIIVILR